MLTTLAVHGYRSLRDVVLPLAPLNVVTGANGVGKSNLYRAFHLLADTAAGRFIGSLAAAGGLPSVLWAGPETISPAMRRGDVPVQGTGSRRQPVSLQFGFASEQLGYLIDVGLPAPSDTIFHLDPVIKRELIWAGPVLRPAATLVQRTARGVMTVTASGRERVDLELPGWTSLLDELTDPQHHPDIAAVRAVVRGWRFYDSFRVDADSPVRLPQVGTRTEVLAGDGHDLAPAVATILESAWAEPFRRAVADALGGATVSVAEAGGRFEVELTQPGLLRPVTLREASDGTLRFLLLAAALFSPRPPSLMVLNEPETSLHHDLLPAVSRLMVAASQRCQLVVVSHARTLVEGLVAAGASHHALIKPFGETEVEGQGLLSRPPWQWGRR